MHASMGKGMALKQPRRFVRHPTTPLRTAATTDAASATRPAEDKWIECVMEAIVPDVANLPQPLASLQALCVAALATARMPTTRNEEYRFTDINSLLARTLAPAAPSSAAHLDVAAVCTASSLEHTPAATVVVLDGVVSKQHSHSGKLPAGVYVGSLAEAPQHVASLALGTQSCARGGMFATLNGAAARDAVVVYVPSHTVLPGPVHTLYLSSSPTVTTSAPRMAMPAATPRLLVVLEEGAMAHIVEEFRGLQAAEGAADDAGVPCGAPIKLINAVAEFELDDGAALQHSYVQLESAGSAHFKATLVNQGRESSYTLTEARMGGSLSRHDLSIAQLGDGTHSQIAVLAPSATATRLQMRSFLLCGDGQLHDLHSKLRLDHPHGEASQLHKCIVSAPTGRGVFDGNVCVNRLAQKTDAQQLSRNLLLVPRATVNVKPNLQIIADDVKCTHGCTVSDLEEEELFYLRARGISTEVARQMLVYSFGREVVQGLQDAALQARVEAAVRQTLAASAVGL